MNLLELIEFGQSLQQMLPHILFDHILDHPINGLTVGFWQKYSSISRFTVSCTLYFAERLELPLQHRKILARQRCLYTSLEC